MVKMVKITEMMKITEIAKMEVKANEWTRGARRSRAAPARCAHKATPITRPIVTRRTRLAHTRTRRPAKGPIKTRVEAEAL
jgi:hypothetical protein